jgi:hypothetical protein
MPKLRTIGVLPPANSAEQFSICGPKGDEVAPTAMVRPQNKFLRPQLGEGPLNVGCPKSRAIPPDDYDFVIAELRYFFHGVLKASGKIATRLTVRAGTERRLSTN